MSSRKEESLTESSAGPNELENGVNQILQITLELSDTRVYKQRLDEESESGEIDFTGSKVLASSIGETKN